MGIACVKLITYSQERFRTSNYSRWEVKSRVGRGVKAKKTNNKNAAKEP